MKALGDRFSNQNASISADIRLGPVQQVKTGASNNRRGATGGVDQTLLCKHVNECCDLWVSASHGGGAGTHRKRPVMLIYGIKKKTLTRSRSLVYRRFPPNQAHASGAPPALTG